VLNSGQVETGGPLELLKVVGGEVGCRETEAILPTDKGLGSYGTVTIPVKTVLIV
jgi:hypothetical protein